MPRHLPSVILVVLATLASSRVLAEHSRFAQTQSRSQYVHWIDLYDANNRRIDPTAEAATPYSPLTTCGRCHDYEAIASGHHFNSLSSQSAPGRPGEPWIWTDPRTGTQIPLSYRGWEGTFKPQDLEISPWDFVLKFGHHLPGGGPGQPPADEEAEATESAEGEAEEPEATDEEEARWELSGWLNIDCMICHDNNRVFSQEAWWEQVEEQNFSWASTVAAGMGSVEGEVSRLPDDFDPETVEETSRYKLPTTTYHGLEINGDKKVLFKVTRQPDNNACYYCHSNRLLGNETGPAWTHDEDVHLKSGLSCTDCHPNGIGHHTVRGFEGEVNPSGEPVETLSCRGCHLGEVAAGGRLGAPKPMHKGLPPLHLERLACTTCHSGPRVADENFQVQTAMAHGLGMPSHDYSADMAPGIVAPVLLQDDGKLYPHRMMWPAFWGQMKDDLIVPLNPETVYGSIRSVIRVKRGDSLQVWLKDVRLKTEEKVELFGEERSKVKDDEMTDEEKAKLDAFINTRAIETWKEKLPEALETLKEIISEEDAEPVFVSGGKAYRLAEDGTTEEFPNAAAEPYAWKFAHDVRPARWSNGVKGCYECHSAGSAIFESQVTAISQALDEAPITKPMYELSGYDKGKLDAWSQSFQGRSLFKYAGFIAMGVVALILLAYVVSGIQGLYGKLRQ